MNRRPRILPLLFALAFAAGAARAAGPEPKRAPDKPAPAAKPAAKPATEPAVTQDTAKDAAAEPPKGPKEDPNLGMSILGNQEAPKSLVIVPWKSSEIGQSVGLSTLLDDSRQPIDKDVFLRVLSYYDLRSDTTRHDGAAAAAPHGRKP